MTGSLQIKNGKYYMVLNTHTPEGKRKLKWLSTGLSVKGNKKKAEALLRKTLNEYEEETLCASSEMLFSDAVKLWLAEAEQHVDEVTMQGYRSLANVHIIPYFDAHGLRLCDITHTILQAYVDEKAKRGRVDGKGGLSARSLILHKNVLNQTLKCAVRDGLISNNPCEFVRLPVTERHEAHFYTESQLVQLFEAAKDEPLLPAIKFTALYGVRRSELCGLRWQAIDFERKTIVINHTVVKVSKTIEKDKTKNTTSRRIFPLDPEIEVMLLKMKARQEENKRLLGKAYAKNDYVFCWDDGRPFSPDYVSQRFAKILQQNNLPHIRFHELRHSCASNLLNMGFTLKDVQEWLGHSDIKMTANIYGHLDISRKRAISDTLSSHLLTKEAC